MIRSVRYRQYITIISIHRPISNHDSRQLRSNPPPKKISVRLARLLSLNNLWKVVDWQNTCRDLYQESCKVSNFPGLCHSAAFRMTSGPENLEISRHLVDHEALRHRGQVRRTSFHFPVSDSSFGSLVAQKSGGRGCAGIRWGMITALLGPFWWIFMGGGGKGKEKGKWKITYVSYKCLYYYYYYY